MAREFASEMVSSSVWTYKLHTTFGSVIRSSLRTCGLERKCTESNFSYVLRYSSWNHQLGGGGMPQINFNTVSSPSSKPFSCLLLSPSTTVLLWTSTTRNDGKLNRGLRSLS